MRALTGSRSSTTSRRPGPAGWFANPAATGGLGGYATQLVAGAGARVIATAQADEADYVRGLGAAEVIDYRRQDVASAVRAAHPEGIDGLIDTVSDPAAFGALAALVRPGGRAASPIGSADVAGLAQRQVRAANAGNPASTEALGRLAELVGDGRLRVLAITRLPLEHEQHGAHTDAVRMGAARSRHGSRLPERENRFAHDLAGFEAPPGSSPSHRSSSCRLARRDSGARRRPTGYAHRLAPDRRATVCAMRRRGRGSLAIVALAEGPRFPAWLASTSAIHPSTRSPTT
jgi:Zinc-binding dehydrogenase